MNDPSVMWYVVSDQSAVPDISLAENILLVSLQLFAYTTDLFGRG